MHVQNLYIQTTAQKKQPATITKVSNSIINKLLKNCFHKLTVSYIRRSNRVQFLSNEINDLDNLTTFGISSQIFEPYLHV